MLDLKSLLIALAVGLLIGVLGGWHFAAKHSNQLEKQHVESTQKLDGVLADNRRLAHELGGLRDPGRRPSCGGAMPETSTTTGQPEGGAAEAELSAEASEFLLELARSADAAAQYGKTCHAWTGKVK